MQTIEKRETESPRPGGPNSWKWLAAAVVIAVLATAGIILFATAEGEPTVATTPQVEEDPVPSTEPEAVEEVNPVPSTEAVDEDEPTPPTSAPDAEVPGVTGLPIFAGQPPAGDYEAVADDLRIVFTSNGSWKDCVQSWCDFLGGVAIKPTELLSVYGWIETLPTSVDQFRSVFTETPGLVVGEIEVLSPAHPEAEWTGATFTVDLAEDAGSHPFCNIGLAGSPFPCVEVNDLGPWWLVNENVPLYYVYIHGPSEFHVLTKSDGTRVWAAAMWYPFPQAPEGMYDAINQRFLDLVQTIRFID